MNAPFAVCIRINSLDFLLQFSDPINESEYQDELGDLLSLKIGCSTDFKLIASEIMNWWRTDMARKKWKDLRSVAPLPKDYSNAKPIITYPRR